MQALSPLQALPHRTAGRLQAGIEFGAKNPLTYEEADRQIAEAARERCQEFRDRTRRMVRNTIIRSVAAFGIPIGIIASTLAFRKHSGISQTR